LILSGFKTDDSKIVSGYVFDDQQTALSGAVVKAKTDQKNRVITDANGFFRINVSQTEKTLVVSFLGFETQEARIINRVLKVFLKLEQTSLEEVAVIGYGIQKRESITGSVAGVSHIGNAKMMVRGFSGNQIYTRQDFNTENYSAINENGFKTPTADPLSTFS